MSHSIVLCVILSTLSIAVLGQISLSTECINAANSFTQESDCFGSDGVNYFRSSIGLNSNVMTSSNDQQQAIRSFYNNFCTSQYCVNRYADVVDICSRGSTQVSICYHICTFTLHEHGVVYIQGINTVSL